MALVYAPDAQRMVRPMTLDEALQVWPIVARSLQLGPQAAPRRRWWPRRRPPSGPLIPVRFVVDVEPLADGLVMLTPYCVTEET